VPVEKQQVDNTDSYVGTLEDAVLQNSNQFHKWHSELEAACASETEEKYKRYANLVNQHLESCDQILAKVMSHTPASQAHFVAIHASHFQQLSMSTNNSASQVDSNLELFNYLLAQYHDVSQKSKALSHSCEQLVREKEQLVEFADAIRSKLKHFDEYESVFVQFHSPQFSTDSEQFLTMLRKLDDSIAYVSSNPQYAESATFLSRFRQLQIRGLGMVKAKVQDVLKHATAQVRREERALCRSML
jgi:ABC-type transporter Mla subunit MlaD